MLLVTVVSIKKSKKNNLFIEQVSSLRHLEKSKNKSFLKNGFTKTTVTRITPHPQSSGKARGNFHQDLLLIVGWYPAKPAGRGSALPSVSADCLLVSLETTPVAL